MKQKLTLSISMASLCLLVTCLLLMPGCKRDLFQPGTDVLTNKISIAEARQYFEKNIGKLEPRQKLSSNAPLPITGKPDLLNDNKVPMWDASALRQLTIGTNAVMVPLHRPGIYIHVPGKQMVKYGFLNYLMMHKDAQGKMVTEWIELKPSQKWIESKYVRK